jgi:hypothetical protein
LSLNRPLRESTETVEVSFADRNNGPELQEMIMRKLVLVLCLFCFAGCGAGDDFFIRTPWGTNKELNTNRARYENHFFNAVDGHSQILRRLGENSIAVKDGFEQILANIDEMELYLAEEVMKVELAEYRATFQAKYESVLNKGWQTLYRRSFESLGKNFRSRFYPGKVALVPDAEDGTPPVREPAKDPITNPVKDPVREPVREPVIDPVTEPTREPVLEEREVPVGNPDASTPYWILFNGYTGAHDKLVQAVDAGDTAAARKAHGRVLEALAVMKAQFDAKGAGRLQIYVNEYNRIQGTANEYAALGDAGARDKVKSELQTVREVIDAAYAPE